MSIFLAHLAERILCRPLFIHPTKAEIIYSILAERIGGGPMEIDESEFEARGYFLRPAALSPAANRLVPAVYENRLLGGEGGGPVDNHGRRQLMYMQDGGVAMLPVIGTLVNRGAFLGSRSGVQSYEGLESQLRAAASDSTIHSILLDIDSPGGEASGMFNMAAAIREVREKKRVVAVVNDMAASAAYGIASAAHEIVVSPSSTLGSIGVVMLHMDQSKELEKKGRKPTLIYAGKHKVDGNPFESLSPSVLADLQAEVDDHYNRFVSVVAENRPLLHPQAIRATEARPFNGESAVAVKLADRIGGFNETLASLKSSSQRSRNMTVTTEPRTYSQAEMDNAIQAANASRESAIAAARAEGETAGASAAVERIRAILNHESARGREAQALAIALDTALTDSQATRLLATFPVKTGIPTLAERAAAPLTAEQPAQSNAQTIDADWSRAVEKANRAAGLTSRH